MAEELPMRRGDRAASGGRPSPDNPSGPRSSVTPSLPLSAFDYELPKALIAQEPLPERDRARLMVVQRGSGRMTHHIVRDLPELLCSEDLLILNDTRVLPARLYGRRERTGGKWEGLFLQQTAEGYWELLCQTRGRLMAGESVIVPSVSGGHQPLTSGGRPPPDACPGSELHLRLVAKTPEGHWLAEPSEPGSPEELLQRYGHVPLPPYIRKGHDQPTDHERYQTVFAQRPGAVAAPTAGLHFTPELFRQLEEHGIRRAYVTLHVGIGTFQPIQTANVAEHSMHREWGELPAETAEAICACQVRGGRVVAVGTTSVRVLESVAATGSIRPWSGETGLYIYPPYEFKAVNALLTNFHLPRSSLLVLVSAFAGIELTRTAYRIAIEQGYRFYSYGDAMLIL